MAIKIDCYFKKTYHYQNLQHYLFQHHFELHQIQFHSIEQRIRFANHHDFRLEQNKHFNKIPNKPSFLSSSVFFGTFFLESSGNGPIKKQKFIQISKNLNFKQKKTKIKFFLKKLSEQNAKHLFNFLTKHFYFFQKIIKSLF